MLPVSADHPHTPFSQYPSNNPPHLPNVPILPEAQGLLVHAAAAVANEAGFLSSQSNARMFCYNILSSANWANTAFAEVVKLACDNAVLKTRMGQANSPASVLIDSVREVLALYTSMLIISYPELAQLCSRENVSAAATNNAIYQDLMNTIESLYMQAAPYNAQAHFQGQHPQARGNYQGRGQPPMTHGAAGGHVRNAQPQALANKAASGVFQGRAAAQPSTASRYPSPASNKQAPVMVEVNAPENNKAIKGAIESMDREAHSIVYFGKEFKVPTSPLRRKLEEAVENHEALADATEEVETPFISTAWAAEPSIDELIAVTRANRCAVTNTDLGVYLSYGMVVSPIISSLQMKDLFIMLSRSYTFSETAQILADYLTAIVNSDQLRVALSHVSQIDRIMTRLLNDFLGNMLEETGIAVESFIEDAPTVTRYLNEKFKGKYNNAYTDYQRKVMGHLFKHSRVAEQPDDVSQVTEYVTNPGTLAYWDNMVVAYSLTYITATAKELGYSIESKAKEISAVSTPMFSRLIAAIQKTQAKGIEPSHHLIITSDDARYMLFQKAGNSSAFIIKEV